jgi:hypothetical protein
MFKRLGILLASVAITTAFVAPGASADPKGTAIPSTCDDGNSIQLIFAGNGDFTPGHLVGGTQVYVVQSLDATQIFTPTGGTTTTTHFQTVKPNVHGDLVTCAFDFTVNSSAGTFRGVGTLVAVVAPAR